MTADQRLEQDRILVLGNFTDDTPSDRDWSRVAQKVLVAHGWEADLQSREVETEQLNIGDSTAAIILDTSTPRGLTDFREVPSSIELVRSLRDGLRKRGLNTPILVASWSADFDFVRETYRVGANDWIQMDLNPARAWRRMALPNGIIHDRKVVTHG